MFVGSIKSCGAKIHTSSDKEYPQTIVALFKMYMSPNKIIEILPAISWNYKLFSKWRLVFVIRNDDQLDSFASTVSSNSDTHIIFLGITNIKFVKEPL
jgi:hypothetical protein